MKKVFSILLVLAACSAGNTLFAQTKAVGQQVNVAAPSAPAPISGRQNLARTIIALPDLQAQDVAAMEAQLRTLPGVTRVLIDLNNKQVVLAYDKVATDVPQIATSMRAMNIKMEVVHPVATEKMDMQPSKQD
ncbi:MAG: hypothetical protein ACKVTZ_01270 [Bacteroidia bacterium]